MSSQKLLLQFVNPLFAAASGGLIGGSNPGRFDSAATTINGTYSNNNDASSAGGDCRLPAMTTTTTGRTTTTAMRMMSMTTPSVLVVEMNQSLAGRRPPETATVTAGETGKEEETETEKGDRLRRERLWEPLLKAQEQLAEHYTAISAEDVAEGVAQSALTEFHCAAERYFEAVNKAVKEGVELGGQCETRARSDFFDEVRIYVERAEEAISNIRTVKDRDAINLGYRQFYRGLLGIPSSACAGEAKTVRESLKCLLDTLKVTYAQLGRQIWFNYQGPKPFTCTADVTEAALLSLPYREIAREPLMTEELKKKCLELLEKHLPGPEDEEQESSSSTATTSSRTSLATSIHRSNSRSSSSVGRVAPPAAVGSLTTRTKAFGSSMKTSFPPKQRPLSIAAR